MTNNELLLAISSMLEPIKNDIQDIKGRLKKIEIKQENDIIPHLKDVSSCYTSTYNRYKDSVEDYESMKQDISILKSVVMEHSEKLQKIS